MKKWLAFCGLPLFVLCFLLGCATNSKIENIENEIIPQSTTEEKVEITPEPALPSLTPFPDDSEERAKLDMFPDYWGDWIPEDEPVYILGVKEGMCRVIYDIHVDPAEMKQYYEQCLVDSEWGGGEWNGYNYTLSKHNPRMKLDISIIGSPEGSSRIDVFQEYRAQDGY